MCAPPDFTSYFHYIECSKDIEPEPHSVLSSTTLILLWLGQFLCIVHARPRAVLHYLSSHPCLTSIFWCKSLTLENTFWSWIWFLLCKFACLFLMKRQWSWIFPNAWTKGLLAQYSSLLDGSGLSCLGGGAIAL